MKNKFYTYCQFIGTYKYIGKGTNLRYLDPHKDSNSKYLNAINKYGLTYSVILEYHESNEDAKKAEIEMISLQKLMGYELLNATNGGDGGSGFKSEDTRKKISATRKAKGIKPWNAGKPGLQIAWNKGLTKEDPRIAVISNKLKGRERSVEHAENISKANIGKPKVRTAEHNDKIRAALTGKKKSPSHCQNIRTSLKLKKEMNNGK